MEPVNYSKQNPATASRAFYEVNFRFAPGISPFAGCGFQTGLKILHRTTGIGVDTERKQKL